MPDSYAPLFELFWQNNKLNTHTDAALAQQIDQATRHRQWHKALDYSEVTIDLRSRKDPHRRLAKRRNSQREFSDRPISQKQLAALFSGFRADSLLHRPIASAGAKYPIEVFTMAFNVEGVKPGSVLYYHPQHHGFCYVGDCPPWASCGHLLSRDVQSEPALYTVFCLFTGRSAQKYGERGARFALIEAGLYVQDFSTRLSLEKLTGVPCGGFHDDQVAQWLKQDTNLIKVALGYACGHGV